jgi:hypothetical protein
MFTSGWITKKVKYITMRAKDFVPSDKELEEWKASRKLCTSTKPDSELGTSALSSCKSQGFRARDTDKKFTINKKRQKIKGKKVKGGNYGGPLPVWRGNQ